MNENKFAQMKKDMHDAEGISKIPSTRTIDFKTIYYEWVAKNKMADVKN